MVFSHTTVKKAVWKLQKKIATFYQEIEKFVSLKLCCV